MKIMKFSLILTMFLISVLAVSALPVTVEDGALNVSNNLWVDWNSFFVDSSSDNVGVGFISPLGKLDVAGDVRATDWSNVTITESQISDLSDDDTNAKNLCQDNKVLLGQATTTCVNLNDTIDARDTDTNESTRFNTLVGTDCGGTDKMTGVDAAGNVVCDSDLSSGSSYWNRSSTNTFLAYTEDSVGIGTAVPDAQSKLHVKGNILAENGADSNGAVRNKGILFYTDEAFGTELHYDVDTTIWGTALYTRDDSNLWLGTYATGATAQNTFTKLMTIEYGGNVGIGTATPLTNLQVIGADDNAHGQLLINSTQNDARLAFSNSDGASNTGKGSIILSKSGGYEGMRFMINNADKMIIDENGNVGIGNTNPAKELDVTGAIKATEYWSDSNQGITTEVVVRDSGGTSDCSMIFTDGLLIYTTCTEI